MQKPTNNIKIFFLITAVLFSNLHNLTASGRPLLQNKLTYELKDYSITNYYDLRGAKYDSFVQFLDSNYVISKKNSFSRLKLVNKLTGVLVFDIGMIPSTKIEVQKDKILCISQHLIRGLPQLVIVNFKGEILAMEALSLIKYRCKNVDYKLMTQKYPHEIQLLQKQCAIFQFDSFVELELGRALMLGNCSVFKKLEDDTALFDSIYSNTQFNWVITSASRLIWYNEDESGFKLVFRKKRLLYVKFKDTKGTSTKIVINKIPIPTNTKL